MNRLLCLKCNDYWNGWDDREEVRVGNHILLLYDAIVALCGQRVGERKAIVKDSKAGADYCFQLRRSGCCTRRPRERKSRRKIFPIMNVALGLIAEAKVSR